MQGLAQLGGAAIVLTVVLGPVVGLMGLHNLRDRRQSALLGTVLERLASRQLRGRFAVRVRCAALSRRSIVTIDMRGCSRDEIWDAVTRLSLDLPPHARLVIDGTVGREVPATFTVETPRKPPLCQPSRRSVATG